MDRNRLLRPSAIAHGPASGRAASAASLLAALAVMGALAHGALEPAYANSTLRPHQQPTASSTATPRLIVWTITPPPQVQTATAAAIRTQIAAGVATAIALTAQASTPVATIPPGASPGGPGGPGSPGPPEPGTTPRLGTPGAGGVPAPGTAVTPGDGSPPGSGDPGGGGGGVGAPGSVDLGTGTTGGAGGSDAPGGAATSGDGGPPGGGAGGAGAGVGGGAGGAGGGAGVDSSGRRVAAPWLPAAQDGVIGQLWSRFGSPYDGAPWWRRLTGVSAETSRAGPLGWTMTYVVLALLLLGSVTWVVAEARQSKDTVERKRRRRRVAEPDAEPPQARLSDYDS